MRGILSIDDWIKLAAGVLAGLFVLFIAWVFVNNLIATECWRNNISPFDQALLGTKSIQAPLGSKDSFSISLIKGDCFQAVYFSHGQISCSNDCEQGLNTAAFPDSRYSSSVVNSCKSECGSKCADKDCIVLLPLPGSWGTARIDVNKPRVYGSGDYKFQWDSSLNTKPITKDSKYVCLKFSRSSSSDNVYTIIPSENSGDCK